MTYVEDKPPHPARQKRPNSLKNIKARADAGNPRPKESALMRVTPSTTSILIGTDDVSTWDDEELKHGRKRDKSGTFRGLDPRVVPKAVHDELTRRRLSKANQQLMEGLEDSVAELIGIARGLGEDVEPKDQLRAIGMVMDRVMGKTPDRVEFSGEMKPWEIALRKGIVSVVEDIVMNESQTEEAEIVDG